MRNAGAMVGAEPVAGLAAEAAAGSDDPEGRLLMAYARGDAVAARQLVAAIGPRALGQAMRMLADRAEAEDVVQEALLRLWRMAPDWVPGQARVTTWLYRVVANLCTDRLRRRRGIGIDEIAEPADPARSAAEGLQETARLAALAQALGELPDRQAQAVSLRHLEGLSNPEIGVIMGISAEAVESLTARGKRALTAILAGRREALGYGDE